MSSITINVPTWTEQKYHTVLNTLVQNYWVDDLEDALLWLHIENSKQEASFVKEDKVMYHLS